MLATTSEQAAGGSIHRLSPHKVQNYFSQLSLMRARSKKIDLPASFLLPPLLAQPPQSSRPQAAAEKSWHDHRQSRAVFSRPQPGLPASASHSHWRSRSRGCLHSVGYFFSDATHSHASAALLMTSSRNHDLAQ